VKACDHPYARWASVVLDDFARRGPGERTFAEAMTACWGHSGRASWALYFLVLLGRLEKHPRADGFGKGYTVADAAPLVAGSWTVVEAPPTETTVSVEYDEAINEKGWAQECVFVGCDVEGTEERAWGQSKASVWRGIFRLNETCPCGLKHLPRVGEFSE
jgi:hypothetical protein